jgi:hypothetical protein
MPSWIERTETGYRVPVGGVKPAAVRVSQRSRTVGIAPARPAPAKTGPAQGLHRAECMARRVRADISRGDSQAVEIGSLIPPMGG